MNIIIIFAILSLLSIFGVKQKKVLEYLWIVFFVIIITFNNGISDRGNYYWMFERVNHPDLYNISNYNDRIEISFRALCRVLGMLGFTQYSYILALSLIAVLLYYKTIKRYTSNVSLVFFLFALFPLALEATQLRTMLIDALVIFSLRFLEEKNFKNIMFYIMMILLAASIHYSAIFFLIFLLKFLEREKWIRRISLAGLLFSFFIIANINSFFNYFSSHFSALQENTYFVGININRKKVWGYLVLILVLFFIIGYVEKIILHYKKSNYSIKTQRFLKSAFASRYCLLLTFPLVMINTEFSRLLRPFMVITYILFSVFLSKCSNKIGFSVNGDKKSGSIMIAVSYIAVVVFVLTYGGVFGVTYGKLVSDFTFTALF